MKNELLRYWPYDDEVRACVKTDAEASSEAVSLAVHQPMHFERRTIGGSASVEQCSEHDLLRAFLTDELPEGRVILPIVGSSGVGKSHVVRWLDTQIRNQPGAKCRVVIRVPKGTSLRRVLGILLEKVEGSVYDEYRRELTRAQQELDPHEAAGLLCEMLAHTLTAMADDARATLAENPNDRNAREREAFCGPQMLPALLRNQYLRDHHFLKRPDGSAGVAARLVEQLTETCEAGSDDDRQNQFFPADLDFSAVAREELGRVEQRALGLLRDERLPIAAKLLNAALDGAKQRLLRLDPTVSDLFDKVRRELLKEGRELILLVEDFAVLSGLQKQLLQIIIKEAIRDGRQVLCTMRTALAYTTGYLDAATVLTRANFEYQIPNEPGDEDEIVGRISRLVGAYLNAARVGQGQLEREYAANRSQHSVPTFSANVEPDVQATIDSFGKSKDGYSLFPFNEAAITELAKEGCLHDGRLVYNPRFVIQNVINKVLRHRSLFEHGAFPPSGFGLRNLPAKVTEYIRHKVPTGELDRYLRFIAYWGGFPGSVDEFSIPDRVFSAFALNSSLFRGKVTKGQAATPAPLTATQQQLPASRPKQIDDTRSPLEVHWEQFFERWRSGIALPQTDAAQLRKWVAEAIKGAIEWNWMLHRPLDEVTKRDEWSVHWFKYVFIPNAGGNEGRDASESMLAVCTAEDFADQSSSARIASMLMSIVRFHGVHKGTSWEYDGADDDLPRYCAFIDKHVARAREFVRGRYFRSDWNPIPTLGSALVIGARTLGVDGADNDSDEALIAAMFAPVAQHAEPAVEDASGWQHHKAYYARARKSEEKEMPEQLSWTTHLLNLVGARQGRGDTVHAVDVVSLKTVLREVRSTWALGGSLPSPSGVLALSPLKTLHADLKRTASAISKARDRVVAWRHATIEWLGETTIDKDALVREMKATLEAARTAGLAREVDHKKLHWSIEAFRLAGVVASLEDAAELEASSDRGIVLKVLARTNEKALAACDELRQRYEEFLNTVNAEVESQSQTYGTDPHEEARTELASQLTVLGALLSEVSR